MKTKLVSALGLALLAASLTFNSSFACSQSSEATVSALPAIALESNEAATESLPVEATATESLPVTESLPAAAAAESASIETSTSEALPAQVDEPAAIVSANESANESSPIEAAATDRSVAAIVVEIVETVTIVVPGQSADDEEVEHTGSTSPDRADAEPASVLDAEALAADGEDLN
jgi:hypothetical protein